MKFSIVIISFFVFMLCLTHFLFVTPYICPAPIPTEYGHVKAGNIVAAYVASWDKYGPYKISDIEAVADHLTHIFYAFAKPDATTATCNLHDPWADVGANFEHRKKVGGHFGQLLALKKKYPHLKIILSVGGGGKNSKSLLAIAQHGNIDRFVDSTMKLLTQYFYNYTHSQYDSEHVHVFNYPELFDGIDLDWEWPSCNATGQQVAWYHEMVAAFAQKLKEQSVQFQKKYIFTCAVQANCKIVDQLRLHDIAHHVDWFNLMAYDFGGPAAMGVSMNAPICNPNSSYSIDSVVHRLMVSKVVPSKLVLGIPLYGHVYDQAPEKLGASFEKTDVTGILTYGQIKDLYVENDDCVRKWHKKTHVPYVYCPADNIFVSYDDTESIRFKLSYAQNKRLRGIFFWKLSGDQESHGLIKSVFS